MKKSLFFIAVAGLLCFSCSDSGKGSSDDNSTGSFEENNSGFENNGTVYQEDGTEESTVSGNLYFVEERNPQNGEFIYADTTMLEVGVVENGKVFLNLPQNVDSRFLSNLSGMQSIPGLTIKPLDAEALFYDGNFHVMDGYDNIGNLIYGKLEEVSGDRQGYDEIIYWYVSKDTDMKGVLDGGNVEYKISAKRGWNKVYHRYRLNEDYTSRNYLTTNLDEAPSGLEWIVY